MYSCSHLSLLSLLWSLVEVHCQTAPYLTFMGNNVPNHGYVDLSQVGDDYRSGSEGVQCITDLATCCSSDEGPHRGDWYFPDGARLLENAACLSKMYGHYISQVLTKMWELVIFVRDQHHYCLISSKKLDGW